MNCKRPYSTEINRSNSKVMKLAFLEEDSPCILPELVIEHALSFLYKHEFFIPALVCKKWRSYFKKLYSTQHPTAMFVCGYAWSGSLELVRFLLHLYLGNSADKDHSLFKPCFMQWLKGTTTTTSPHSITFNGVVASLPLVSLKGAAASSGNLEMVSLVTKYCGTGLRQEDIEFVCFNPNLLAQENITNILQNWLKDWKPADIDLKWMFGAVWTNNVALVKFFIEHGVLQPLGFHRRVSILITAIGRSKRFSILKYLLEHVPEFQDIKYLTEVMRSAAKSGNLGAISYVTTNWKDINFTNNSKFFKYAGECTTPACLKLLYNLGFKYDSKVGSVQLSLKF